MRNRLGRWRYDLGTRSGRIANSEHGLRTLISWGCETGYGGVGANDSCFLGVPMSQELVTFALARCANILLSSGCVERTRRSISKHISPRGYPTATKRTVTNLPFPAVSSTAVHDPAHKL